MTRCELLDAPSMLNQNTSNLSYLEENKLKKNKNNSSFEKVKNISDKKTNNIIIKKNNSIVIVNNKNNNKKSDNRQVNDKIGKNSDKSSEKSHIRNRNNSKSYVDVKYSESPKSQKGKNINKQIYSIEKTEKLAKELEKNREDKKSKVILKFYF